MDGHGFIEPVFGQDKPADMLRQMAREFYQLFRQRLQPGNFGIVRIKPGLNQPPFIGATAETAPDGADHARGDILGQAQSLSHFAHRAARAVMDDRSGNRGPVAAIAPIDILHHLLTPLMFEINVDIGRFFSVGRNEARK